MARPKQFSPEEDVQILHMRREGHGWTAIAKSIPGSNRFNVKRRYVLYLCPENDGQRLPTQKKSGLQIKMS